jgi:hypothetical protein
MELRNLFKSVGMRPDYRMLGVLVDRWRRCAGDQSMPSRADLDPARLGPVLGHIFLIDVDLEPLRFRIRLSGTKIEETFGYSEVGRYIDDPGVQFFERGNLADYKRTVFYKRPHFTCGQAWSVSDGRINFMRLLLPLSSDGNTVDMILGGIVPSMRSRFGGSDKMFPEDATERRSAIAG